MLELGAKRELYGVWKKSKGAKGLFVGPNKQEDGTVHPPHLSH